MIAKLCWSRCAKTANATGDHRWCFVAGRGRRKWVSETPFQNSTPPIRVVECAERAQDREVAHQPIEAMVGRRGQVQTGHLN
jgi:hypothetical protein